MKKGFKLKLFTFFAVLILALIPSSAMKVYAATNTTAYVTSVQATLHTEASNDSDTLTVPYGTELVIIGGDTSDSGWIEVTYDGTTYYMYRNTNTTEENYLTTTAPTSSYKNYSTYADATEYQQAVMKLAWSYLSASTSYGHGDSSGTADSSGSYVFDCSGFAAYLINTVMQEDVPLYKVSSNINTLYNTDNIYNEGYTGAFSATVVCKGTLDEDALEPGDIIFFNIDGADSNSTSSYYNHCGIYLGDGEFIQATNTWDGVCVMPLTGIYEDGFVRAIRYLPDSVTKANQTMYTTSLKTNVYSTNDSSTTAKTTLTAEVKVTLQWTDSGNWGYVKYTNTSGKTAYGYILLKYLSADDPDATSSIRYVKSSKQKLYTSNSTTSSYITVTQNTQLTYYGKFSTSSYYKVDYEGSRYYIYVASGKSISTYLGTTTKLSSSRVSLSYTSTTYSGSAKKPTVTVKNSSGTKLTKNTHYTVKYSSNKSIGTATVTVTGIGKYRGTVTKTFTIKPAKVTISSLKSSSSKKLTVKWSKVSGSVTYYQVYYRVKGTSTWKKVTVSGSSSTISKTISSLKSGKTYQVKVRAYKKVSGTYYYGSWSTTKTVTVK